MPVDSIPSCEQRPSGCGAFATTLAQHGLRLEREATRTLQVNVGLLCDLFCRHCHLEAGPQRHETMTRQTMDDVIAYAQRVNFETIDVTGGAPELSPDIDYLLRSLTPLTKRVMVRTNLVALHGRESDDLAELYRQLKVVLVASLPATNAAQTDALRGKGVWDKSIAMLKKLNEIGYGKPESDLELDLTVNPAGAFLPEGQRQAERRFRQDLLRKQGIQFNNLFTFANVPLGRFRSWLEQSGNRAEYLQKLAASFNPATVAGLMCRTLISVAWDGTLYDCDFNQAAGLPYGKKKLHVSQLAGLPEPGTIIPVADHCYACTAGAGFTCGGTIAA